MNNLSTKQWRATKPDAQGFDEVRFVVTPRYKESGLSGDEWRISITMQFYRNGNLIHEEPSGRDMESAMSFAGFKYAKACDDGHAYFAGQDEYCDQEGCSKIATVTYRIKEEFCRDGHKKEKDNFREAIRKFCDTHKTRGDCGLEDADRNYEEIKEGNYPLTAGKI